MPWYLLRKIPVVCSLFALKFQFVCSSFSTDQDTEPENDGGLVVAGISIKVMKKPQRQHL